MKKLTPSLLALSLTAASAGMVAAQSSDVPATAAEPQISSPADTGYTAPVAAMPSWNDPAAPRSREEVKAEVRDALRNGDRPHGEAGVTDQDLAASYHTTRAPVRVQEADQVNGATGIRPDQTAPASTTSREEITQDRDASGVRQAPRGNAGDADMANPDRAN